MLDEPFHLSYPYVFKHNDEYYMIPETYRLNSIRLYKAIDFPAKWSYVKTLLSGKYFRDSSIFTKDGKWWMFTTPTKDNDILLLYYSDDLLDTWTEHPKNPIIHGDRNSARSGGRVLYYDGRIIRYAQDCDPSYGNQVRAFEIDTLTPTEYKEHEIEVVVKASGSGWNADGMHHIDPHYDGDGKWSICVDGHTLQKRLVFGWYR